MKYISISSYIGVRNCSNGHNVTQSVSKSVNFFSVLTVKDNNNIKI